jgi:hypothetical protein
MCTLEKLSEELARSGALIWNQRAGFSGADVGVFADIEDWRLSLAVIARFAVRAHRASGLRRAVWAMLSSRSPADAARARWSRCEYL